MRTVKKHDVRLNEILDASEELFFSKGYENTTINDVLGKVEIGKGTFYHYFKSKEEVLDAIIMRLIKSKLEVTENIANKEGMNATEKIAAMLFAQKPQGQQEVNTITNMHTSSNALFHQKSIQKTISDLSPVFAKVFEQGISEKVFSNPFPKETSELLLMAQFVFDDGLFIWTDEELMNKVDAYIYGMEAILGAKKGTFSFITEMFKNSQREDTL